MKQHVRTAVVVVFLSSLIWIFAERQVAREHNLDIRFNLPTGRQELLVELIGVKGPLDQSHAIVRVKIAGPAGRIQEIRDEAPRFEIPLTLDQIGYRPEGPAVQELSVRLIDAMDSRLRYKNFTVPVMETNPAAITVRVTRLTRAELPVRVYDAVGNPLEQAEVSPPAVQAYVANDNITEARVLLSAEEESRAARAPIPVRATSPGRIIDPLVRVQLPERTSLWTDTLTIKAPQIGCAMAPSMQGRYRVVIEDDPMFDDPITCRGSALAVRAYAESPFQLLLEIKPDDKPGVPIDRPLRYNLPDEHAEIEIVERQRLLVRFQLVPLEAATP